MTLTVTQVESVLEIETPGKPRVRLALVSVIAAEDQECIRGDEMMLRGSVDPDLVRENYYLVRLFIGNTCEMPSEWGELKDARIIIPNVVFTGANGNRYVQAMEREGPHLWLWRWVFVCVDDVFEQFGAGDYFLKTLPVVDVASPDPKRHDDGFMGNTVGP